MSTNSTDTESDADAPSLFCSPSEFRIPDGEQLREMRLLAQLNQTEVADEIGVDRDTIRRWEDGEHSPRGETICELLRLFEEEAAGQTQIPNW